MPVYLIVTTRWCFTLESIPATPRMSQTNDHDPFALNDDGTAKDPVLFKQALLSDPSKMEALQQEPEVLQIVTGDDVHAFQELIKSVYQVPAVMENIFCFICF